MISVLIFAVDAMLRRTLEQLPKRDTDIRIVGIADDQQSFVRLADKPHGPRLSIREIAVLTAMADGLSNKEIARRLGISFHTVKFHVASILEKLEADTRTEAVIKAAQLGLVML